MTELEIDAFLAIVKAGNITAAAEKSFITQSALSRRIITLEKELGYTLIRRRKGVRTIELTDEGNAFVLVAEKWKAVWNEAREIVRLDRHRHLDVASVGSVSTYILPPVFCRFMGLNPEYRLSFHNYHSFEAYGYVESGQIDLAIISDDMYSKNVETIPLFKEEMVLVTTTASKYNNATHPSMLDASREIRLPWNPEYDLWHDFWFKNTDYPHVFLDQMSLMEYFIVQPDTWAIVPISVAGEMNKRIDLSICRLHDSPPDRIIYLLLGKKKKPEITNKFLEILNEELISIRGIESYVTGNSLHKKKPQ